MPSTFNNIVTTATKSLGHGVDGTVDMVMRPGEAAKLHATDKAISEDSMAYRERLGDVNKTTETVDNVLTVLSDPKKMLGIVMAIGVLLLVIFIFRKTLKSALSSLWDTIKSPFAAAINAENDKKDLEDLTGERAPKPTYSNSQKYKQLADDLHAALKPYNEEENTVFSCLRQIKNNADWIQVKAQYGSRPYHKGWGYSERVATLEATINDTFTQKNRKKCVDILVGNGVDRIFIAIEDS